MGAYKPSFEQSKIRPPFLLKGMTARKGATTAPIKPVRRKPAWAVGAFTALALVLVVVVASLASVDARLDPPRINISRWDYEQALARWRAQNVEEYVITTAGVETATRVSNNGRDIVVLSPIAFSSPTPGFIDYLRADTVEGMFAEIEKALASDGVMQFPGDSNGLTFYMAYTVRFHPDLGYPTYLERHAVSRPGVSLSDMGRANAVKELTIITQSTPAPAIPTP